MSYKNYINENWFAKLDKEWRDYYYRCFPSRSYKDLYLEIFKMDSCDCTELNLNNLKGIEYCVNLKKLDFSYNDIEDLSDLRYCFNLTDISCEYNELTSLKGLENCYNLSSLQCFENNIDYYNKETYNYIRNCVNIEYLNLTNLVEDDDKIFTEFNLYFLFPLLTA